MKDKLDSRKKLIDRLRRRKDQDTKDRELPEGYFSKCPSCEAVQLTKKLEESYYVCESCGTSLKYPIQARLTKLFDGTHKAMEKEPSYDNPIDFPDYQDKLDQARERSGAKEAIQWGEARLDGHRLVYFVMDPDFIMGSMGTYLGEQVTLAFEHATRKKLPLLGISASGGARMQEGIFSLMQMAKVMGAIENFQQAGLLYISLLTNPTTGGVTASFALQGDINIGEPGALIGFAGPRVIKETTGQNLPEGFQTSEFLEEKGFLDMVLPREEQKEILSTILALHERS